MATLLAKRRLPEKPPLGTTINWSHPLARGLRICHLFTEGGGEPVNLVNQRLATRSNGPLWTPQGMRFADGSDQSLIVGDVPEARITGPLTIVTRFRSFDDALGQQIVAKDNNSGGRAYTLDYDSQAGRQVRFYINGGGGGTSDPILNSGAAGFDLVNSRWYLIVATFKPGSFIRLYIDGKLWSSGSANYSNIPSATANLRYGRRDYSGEEAPMDGEIAHVYVYDRFFTSAEARWVTAEPYALLEPQRTANFATKGLPHGLITGDGELAADGTKFMERSTHAPVGFIPS